MSTIDSEPLSSTTSTPALAEPMPSTSSVQQASLTSAAAARKKKLEEDPWTADVQSRSVWCVGCETRIKLSAKSLYDSYHWEVHKRRCKKVTTSRRNQQFTKRKITTSKSKGKEKAKKASPAVSISSRETYMSTPPLTSDDDDDELSSADQEESPPPIPVRRPTKRDFATEQYLARSHGIHIRLPPTLPEFQDDWRQWSWSQLRIPEFATATTTTSPSGLPKSEAGMRDTTASHIDAARQGRNFGGDVERCLGDVKKEIHR